MVKALTPDGHACFPSPFPEQSIDAVIYCTGYKYIFPFLDVASDGGKALEEGHPKLAEALAAAPGGAAVVAAGAGGRLVTPLWRPVCPSSGYLGRWSPFHSSSCKRGWWPGVQRTCMVSSLLACLLACLLAFLAGAHAYVHAHVSILLWCRIIFRHSLSEALPVMHWGRRGLVCASLGIHRRKGVAFTVVRAYSGKS
jgi:hypothetical protein